MTKLCDKTLVYPLKLIFRAPFKVFFYSVGKKANVVPIHKKESKNLPKTIDKLAFLQFLANCISWSILEMHVKVEFKISNNIIVIINFEQVHKVPMKL